MQLADWAAEQVEASRNAVGEVWDKIASVRRSNQRRVLNAFRRARISEHHLSGTTGYGYGDAARDGVESLYSEIFNTEAALVRPQIVSGTHAISACLFGLCRPGDEIISATGEPYDTLQRVITGPGNSLVDWGISYKQVNLSSTGQCDIPAVLAALSSKTRLVMVQRSRGYALRPSLRAAEIGAIAQEVKAVAPQAIVFVDNCYGEFVEEKEPTHFPDVDIMAGSLIKNPGGTLAPSGGYVVGKAELVERVADALTAPGLGSKVGPMLGVARPLLQGLYLAPLLVAEAVSGAVLAAHVFAKAGYVTYPEWDDHRADAVQAIALGSVDAVLAFCKAVQQASPIDSTAVPTPAELPGYNDPIVMAAGTFVQGASSELSADAPLRPPYAVFLQGGSSRDQTELAIELALQHLAKEGCLPQFNGIAFQ